MTKTIDPLIFYHSNIRPQHLLRIKKQTIRFREIILHTYSIHGINLHILTHVLHFHFFKSQKHFYLTTVKHSFNTNFHFSVQRHDIITLHE